MPAALTVRRTLVAGNARLDEARAVLRGSNVRCARRPAGKRDRDENSGNDVVGVCAPVATSANGTVAAHTYAARPERQAAATAPATMSDRIVWPLGREVSNVVMWTWWW